MAREIKFRAWDKDLKIYDDEVWLHCQDCNKIYDKAKRTYDTPNIEIELVDYENERYTLEQYTGLKDKNGTEIYEGDIVRAAFYVDRSPGSVLDDEHIGVIKWRKVGAGFSFDSPNSPFHRCDLLWWVIDNCKVIGNIHENPELLENKNER